MSNILSINNKDYPHLLKSIKDPPQEIFYKGTLNQQMFEKCLAVVGSRKITSYGKYIIQKFVTQLAQAGITIVSGFMYGVDAHAHQAALNAGGRTIAVMPCGINLIHPNVLINLYNKILNSDNLIISEYGGKFKPCLWTYPRRNRIIAGLCQAVLVVEAQEKSGSLITARFAKKYNRKIFCIPGQLNSLNSKGVINLIKEGNSVVGDISDLLNFYQISLSNDDGVEINCIESLIINSLKFEPMDFDLLTEKTGLNNNELGSNLTMLLLKEKIIEQEGKYYVN